MNKHVLFTLSFLLVVGCSRHSETAKLWHKSDQYLALEERYMTKDQAAQLKQHLGEDLKYDNIGRFYVKQSFLERSIKAPMIILVTPFTMVIDGFSFVVGGFADVGGSHSTSTGGGGGDQLALAILQALMQKW